MGDLDPTSNTWFLQPTRAHNPNNISIHAAGFARLTTVTTDQPTDHATQSVTVGCMYEHTLWCSLTIIKQW